MTQADDPKPVATDAATTALVANADRLGLKWDLRPGTVAGVNPLTVIVDGDTEPIGATSMIGVVATGARVFILITPPSGVFIIGALGDPLTSAGRGCVGFVASTAAIGYTTELVLLTLPPILFESGRAYELKARAGFTSSLAGFELNLFRRGTTIAGAAIGEWEFPNVTGGGASQIDCDQIYTAGVDVTQQLVFTGITTAGVATIIHTQPFGPFWFGAWDIGPASRYPGAPSI